MKALICGGRGYRDQQRLFLELDRIHAKRAITLVITGAQRTASRTGDFGADWMALIWAASRGIDFHGYPAKWALGKQAGFSRNMRMAKEEMPDVVIAFPGGPGTAHMCQIAEEQGIEIIRIGEEQTWG